MANISKGRSPFYPGQPVPVELFVGRQEQIQRIMDRGVNQVSQGKPMAFFIEGEYGIGKSSVAQYTSWLADINSKLFGIYAPLGGANNLDDVAEAILHAAVRTSIFEPTRFKELVDKFGKYLGNLQLNLPGLSFTINPEALKKEAPKISSPFGLLGFLKEIYEILNPKGFNGIFLILDEINGITSNSQFSFFLKSFWESNVVNVKTPVPILLMLCGVEERRNEMIKIHQPIERLFDVIKIDCMTESEMEIFFRHAFETVQMKIDNIALKTLTYYSAGFPKIMHLVGDAAYWINEDDLVDENDALKAIFVAAKEVGEKYVDQQIYKALRSSDYRSILNKIAKISPNQMSFIRKDVLKGLNETEKNKFDNFLQKMKRLKALKKGDIQGEYVFTMRMVKLYIWMQSAIKNMK